MTSKSISDIAYGIFGNPSSFAGPQGFQGNRGFQGNQGSQGNQGFQGSQGAQGNRGFQGAQGAQGAPGGPSGSSPIIVNSLLGGIPATPAPGVVAGDNVINLGFTPSVGNSILVCAALTGSALASIRGAGVGSMHNSGSSFGSSTGNLSTIAAWGDVSTPGATTVTITLNASFAGTSLAYCVREYSGVSAGKTVTVSNTQSSIAASNAPAVADITPLNGDLVADIFAIRATLNSNPLGGLTRSNHPALGVTWDDISFNENDNTSVAVVASLTKCTGNPSAVVFNRGPLGLSSSLSWIGLSALIH